MHIVYVCLLPQFQAAPSNGWWFPANVKRSGEPPCTAVKNFCGLNWAESQEVKEMSIIGMIIVGLIAGVVAKLIMPGKDPGGVVVTILLGLGGSVVAGLLGRSLGLYEQSQMAGVAASIIGAILLLVVYRIIKRGAPRPV